MRLSERAWQIVTALSMTAGRGPLARTVAGAAGLTPADRFSNRYIYLEPRYGIEPTWTSGRSGTAPPTGSGRTCSCG